MSPKRKTSRKLKVAINEKLPRRSEEAEASDWDFYYRAGEPWRSSGLGDFTRHFLMGVAPGAAVLEIGCGAGDDAKEIVKLGFKYHGIDVSREAVRQASTHLLGMNVSFVAADFFSWHAETTYAAVYEKGVFHGLAGLRRRRSFARRIAMILNPDGVWITVCGTADDFDPRLPRGAMFLTHLIEAVEPYFEILQVIKGPYGVRKPGRDFNAWYGLFRRRR